MNLILQPVGYVQTDAQSVPHFWNISQTEGYLVIDEAYRNGIQGLKPGQRIFVIFQFHRSPPFCMEQTLQFPRNQNEKKGVFAISSPIRPNPLGLSVVKILDIEDRYIRVIGLDMLDGTPIMDIKPYAGVKETASNP